MVESWRSIDAGLMVVKTSLKTKEGREVSMISYLEEMSTPGAPNRELLQVRCGELLKANAGLCTTSLQ